MRPETSIVTSLDELRSLHLQRLENERARDAREQLATVEATRTREAAARASADVKVREERAALLALETARAAAEREARLRIEVGEAAERARHQGELDAERQRHELEIRREEARRRRPRWMIAVTALAVCGGLALAYVAVGAARDANAAHERTIAAEQRAREAKESARQSEAQLAAMSTDLEGVYTKLEAAKRALQVATDADARKRAQLAIDEANRSAIEHQRKLDAWKAAEDWKQRHDGLHQDNCVGTALGCEK
ncbi:hypothetical protein BH11MYX1_BH11MYX1_34140 [soil metagenome]